MQTALAVLKGGLHVGKSGTFSGVVRACVHRCTRPRRAGAGADPQPAGRRGGVQRGVSFLSIGTRYLGRMSRRNAVSSVRTLVLRDQIALCVVQNHVAGCATCLAYPLLCGLLKIRRLHLLPSAQECGRNMFLRIALNFFCEFPFWTLRAADGGRGASGDARTSPGQDPELSPWSFVLGPWCREALVCPTIQGHRLE